MTYRIRWTEISTHEVEISADAMAALHGISVEELGEIELTDGLGDALAELDDDGFQGMTREHIEVKEK